MTLHFFHRYDRSAASFRSRCEAYRHLLKEAGLNYKFHSLLDEEYLTRRYLGLPPSWLSVITAYSRRIRELILLKKTDVVIVHIELFPFIPGFFERFLVIRGIKLIYDFDDAFFHLYEHHESKLVRILLSEKIRRIIRRSSGVVAGNRYLEAYARKENSKVVVIPSVIDLQRFPRIRVREKSGESFVIGWIGTPATSSQLKLIHRALKEFCLSRAVRIVLVGSGEISLEGLPLEIRAWTEESEVGAIQEFDVGIMPLFDHAFNRGKGGMKLIQYMACGVPVIASPVGFNNEIVDHGENGFLASTEQDWVNCLVRLYDDKHLSTKLGNFGRKTIEDRYCLRVTGPAFIRFIQEYANPRIN